MKKQLKMIWLFLNIITHFQEISKECIYIKNIFKLMISIYLFKKNIWTHSQHMIWFMFIHIQKKI